MKKQGIYATCIKRVLDFILSLVALIILSPVFAILIVTGTIAMGGNPFFTQLRPGKNEKIFKMVKFRTMSNKRDSEGQLLPDDQRLNHYGKILRSTSLDELPELWNIVKGDLSIVGPRPQLVRDMVFMDANQRRRHSVRQGLTGLAQINGRNNISWEEKLKWDLKYIDEGITLKEDIRIVIKTLGKVFTRSDISTEGMETAEDYGDYLLRTKKVDCETYDLRQKEAQKIIEEIVSLEPVKTNEA